MKKVIYIFLLLFLFGACKQYRIDRAHKAEQDLNYEEAISQYEKLLPKHGDYAVYKNLAILYLKRGEYEKAKIVYDSLILKDEYPREDLLAYTEVLMANDNYDEAEIWIDRYLQEKSDDEKAKALKRVILNQGSFLIDSNQYKLELIDIPATPQAYGAIPYKDGILYTGKANRDEKGLEINPWDGWPFSALYFSVPVDSGWSAPYDFSHSLEQNFHVGPASVYQKRNSNILLLSKSHLSDIKTAKKNNDEKEVVHRTDNKIQLYKVEVNDMIPDTPRVLSFCNPAFNYAQASMSPNGEMMVFTSDMPDGKGGSDLYLSFHDEGKWSKPVNFGSAINTEKNESFPYLISEDTLYFSSEGHQSFGGLDIFYSTFDGDHWTKPVNLLFPLNSYRDDFAISFKEDHNSGYMSSNREGNDKIYAFTQNNPKFRIEGRVILKETQEALPSIKITLTNRSNNRDSIVYSDNEGKFSFPLASNSKYKVKAEEEGFFTLSYNVSTRGRTHSKVFNIVFEMDTVVLNKAIKIEEDPGLALGEKGNSRMKNIYYDFDKWDIRNDAIIELDRLVWLFKDNPKLKIEISSHTDSRGSDDYNLKLSQKRADGVVAYLVDRGLDPTMLVAKGYGEQNLMNKCANGVECTEEEHQENRRSEFKVIEIK